jgi:hypothetical protein
VKNADNAQEWERLARRWMNLPSMTVMRSSMESRIDVGRSEAWLDSVWLVGSLLGEKVAEARRYPKREPSLELVVRMRAAVSENDDLWFSSDGGRLVERDVEAGLTSFGRTISDLLRNEHEHLWSEVRKTQRDGMQIVREMMPDRVMRSA